MGTETLRQTLKRVTADAHMRTERRFEELDVASRAGLGALLLAHRAALRAIAPRLAGEDRAYIRDLCPRLIEAIDHDLGALAIRPTDATAPLSDVAVNPLGMTYVIAGSRLGARILHKRVSDSACPELHGARQYLSSETSDGVWQNLVASLADCEGDDVAMQEIETSALAAFACFERAVAMGKGGGPE